MPRKKNLQSNDVSTKYNAPFPSILRELIEDKESARKSESNERTSSVLEQIATELGISRQQVGYIKNGDSSANAEQIIKLADFFSVSSDFLLGRSSVSQEYKFPNDVSTQIEAHRFLSEFEKDEEKRIRIKATYDLFLLLVASNEFWHFLERTTYYIQSGVADVRNASIELENGDKITIPADFIKDSIWYDALKPLKQLIDGKEIANDITNGTEGQKDGIQ